MDGLALTVDDGVLCHNTVLWGVNLDNLELDLSHTAAGNEEVTLADGAVGLAEVWGEEDIEQRASEAFDGVGNWEDGDALGLWGWSAIAIKERASIMEPGAYIFDVRARVDGDDIAVLDAQVVPHNTVQAAAAVIEVIITKNNQDGVLSLLASDEDGIATEQLESVHGVV